MIMYVGRKKYIRKSTGEKVYRVVVSGNRFLRLWLRKASHAELYGKAVCARYAQIWGGDPVE